MKQLSDYNLNANPFRLVPSIDESELYWAGFKGTKAKYERRIKRSLMIPNSCIVLNWGEYGSGKTHASRYFCKKNVIQQICDTVTEPLCMSVNFPKGKKVINEIITQIIDKIDFVHIHHRLSMIEKNKYDELKNKATDNYFAQSILAYLNNNDFDALLLKKYLYGESTSSDRSKLGFLRAMETDNDFVDVLSALFTFLTSADVYSAIIMWIDEFEDIAYQSISNINSINNFIKVLFDKTPNHFLLFINFTLSAMADVQDLSSYLQDAVKSRIKERIELAIPSKDELLEYLKDLLSNSRISKNEDKEYFPFDNNVISSLIDDIGNVSLRKFNECMSNLLEDALFDDQDEINIKYYNQVKDEIIGWNE